MKEYQGFPISNFRTGFDESVEPWLLPRDAYQVMINAHLYRGVLEKIAGYTLFANMTYRNIVSLGSPNGVTKTFSVTLSSLPVTTNFFAYGTITAGSAAETFSYDSDGTSPIVNLVGIAGGSGTVNISTGQVSITFNTAPPSGTYSSIFFIWDSASPGNKAIMGIKQYFQNNGTQQVMVFDQKRVGIIVPLAGILAAQAGCINAVSEIPHDYYQSAVITGDGSTMTFTGILTAHPFVPGTVVFSQYTSTGVFVSSVVDNGVGGLIGSGVTGSINYVTGAYTITYSSAPASGNVIDVTVGIYGDLFTGGIGNFFTLTNYQYYAFFTNNVDPIFYYNGTTIKYLNTSLGLKLTTSTAGVPNNFNITRCLHVFTYRERLLLINVTVNGVMEVSTIYWSVAGNPLDFIVADGSGDLTAPTSESIRTLGYINTDLIVRFASSERVFRYTADAFSPFRFDSTNNVWDCDSDYGEINYDTWFSTVGKPGVVGSDGVNVTRADERIPDFTDPTRLSLQVPMPFLNQTSIQQCYGERFDDIKEGWLCYNSGPEDQTVPTASDNILSFNYLDATYAVYSFPLSSLGFGQVINVPTWSTTFTNWEDDRDTWASYQVQMNSLIDLGGDQYDRVFELNSNNLQTDVAGDYVPVLMDVITKNFNPFIESGQFSRLGYIDLFVSANQQSTLRVQCYVNDQLYIDPSGTPQGFYQENILQFSTTDAMSPTTNQTKVWKRIYVGAVGKEHTIRFYQNALDFVTTVDQPIFIHAMVLYFKPAGRIFN